MKAARTLIFSLCVIAAIGCRQSSPPKLSTAAQANLAQLSNYPEDELPDIQLALHYGDGMSRFTKKTKVTILKEKERKVITFSPDPQFDTRGSSVMRASYDLEVTINPQSGALIHVLIGS